MTKPIILTVVLMGVGGFALAWLAFDTPVRPPQAPVAPGTVGQTPGSPRAVEIERRYVLRPEDIHADRETPAIAVDAKGQVVVAWASQTGALERTIYLLHSSDGGRNFSPPVPWRKVPIYRFQSKTPGKTMTFSTHVLPRLTAGDGAIWLGWVEAVNGGPEVQYLVARSTDGGRSFSEPLSAHGDKAVRPGFTTLATAGDGTLCASWLDGRNQGQQPFLAVKTEGADQFSTESLVFAGPEGKGICPCCDLAVARAKDGATFVAFRNSDSGYRDISIAQSKAGESAGFAPPTPVTPDHWSFDGCPHDGPSLALSGDRLHVLWMDAHTGQNRVYAASSPRQALAFTPRELSASSPGAQGHPKLVAAPSGTLHAVWDESLDPAGPAPTGSHHGASHSPSAVNSGSGRAIMYASATADGTFGTPRAVAPHPGAFQLNPALAVGPAGDIFIAWNELDTEGKQVVLVKLPPQPSQP